tara:strand:+ start:425 stop:796 length:372 start_codon:yes stop_codon:yes gene_type:complete
MANSTYDRWFGVSVKKTNPKPKDNSLTTKQSAKIRYEARLKLLAKTKNKEEIKSILLNNPTLEFQEGTMKVIEGKKKAVKKGPSVIQQFEKVEDTNDDMTVELKKLKRMIKTSKSSPRKFKRG